MKNSKDDIAEMGFSTRAIHLGYDPAGHHGALTPPVYMTSTYAFESAEEGGEIFAGQRPGFVYGRTRNPTQQLLEERIASLEGAPAGLALATGIGAISATMWSLLEAGDTVLIDQTLYGSTFAFFVRGLTRFGVQVEIADLTRPDEVAAAMARSPRVVFFETPSNPNVRIIDIAAVTGLAHAAGATVVVDNTFASPVLQRPLAHGADLVVHSATKYLGGHGDLLGGVVVGSQDLVTRVRTIGLRLMTGATIAPHTAFLILRGLKTLALRVERHCRSARQIAETFSQHRKVRVLAYPGLRDYPQYDLARRQMSAGGGIVSLRLNGGKAAGMRFINALQLIKCAVSLGDAETLAQHPATMTHATYTEEERLRFGIEDDLVRLSVGLEEAEDLVYDLERALAEV